jgi:hypothetical protein
VRGRRPSHSTHLPSCPRKRASSANAGRIHAYTASPVALAIFNRRLAILIDFQCHSQLCHDCSKLHPFKCPMRPME